MYSMIVWNFSASGNLQAKEAISNRYKTIWKSLHIHRMNDLPISETLLNSAMNTARPFLQDKEPDFILATEIEYEEKMFFATSNETCADKNDEIGWTEVSTKKTKKRHRHTRPKSPLRHPLTTLWIQDSLLKTWTYPTMRCLASI
jgi:hypothetical protein